MDKQWTMPNAGAKQFSLALLLPINKKELHSSFVRFNCFQAQMQRELCTHIPPDAAVDAMWHNYKCIGICIKMMGNSTRGEAKWKMQQQKKWIKWKIKEKENASKSAHIG